MGKHLRHCAQAAVTQYAGQQQRMLALSHDLERAAVHSLLSIAGAVEAVLWAELAALDPDRAEQVAAWLRSVEENGEALHDHVQDVTTWVSTAGAQPPLAPPAEDEEIR